MNTPAARQRVRPYRSWRQLVDAGRLTLVNTPEGATDTRHDPYGHFQLP